MKSLEGRHAVVTGGGRGIGAAIATALGQAGAQVTVTGRTLVDLEAVVAALPMAQAVTCDVAEDGSVTTAFTRAREGFGPVDILVNNAGVANSAPFLKQGLEEAQKVANVNVWGLWRCLQAALPDMLGQGWGRVVNVASTAGLKAYSHIAAYTLSKHAVVGLTRALAVEYARSGVTVNAVCPGYVETDMARDGIANVMQRTGKTEEEARAVLARNNPMRRLIQPEEVAEAVLSFCLPGASSLNGQTLAVDGGEMAG